MISNARHLLLLPLLVVSLTGVAQPAIPVDAELEMVIETRLQSMTLDDKIGQMLQLTLDVFGNLSPDREQFTINETTLDTIISRYRLGSILNAADSRAWPVSQWQEWINLIQEKSMAQLGIPCIYGVDNNHGTTYIAGGTIFPQPINLAASFNTDLARQMARVCAYETRAADLPWVFNPVVDLGRDPRWPRLWESFGEDAIVNARMVEAEVEGYQGDDPNHLGPYNVATCVKHYMGYGAPFSGKDRTPAYIAPNMLREKYFEPYKAALRAGALSIMVNSSSINGTPVHASWEYLTKWIKEDLGWDGMILTDWADIVNLYQREHVAHDKKDAIRIAINAGIDMSMDPYNVDFCALLKELVQDGLVPTSRIDDAVRRILRLKYRLGLFVHPNTGGADYSQFGSREHALQSLHTAEESEVLLKNEDNLLPLKKGAKILLTGPNANQMRCLNGGWSYSWQGNLTDRFTQERNTIYEALSQKFGEDNVILCQGVTYKEDGAYYEENPPEINKVMTIASAADVIIACIGENSYCETPGNLTDLWLSPNQRQLVKELSKTGKPIILVINEGRPRLLSDIEPLAQAIVDIFLPGDYGADALANLLAGEVNFSARMPYTYPSEINSLTTYDYKMPEETASMEGSYNYDARVALQWPFGYGLSYTTYEYSNLTVSEKNFTPSDTLTVSLDVTNSGQMDGKEAVLLYSSDLVASIVPDNRRLRAFTKVDIPAGETRHVEFRLPAKELAFVAADNRWTLEEGEFILRVGRLEESVFCTQTKVWDEPNI